MRVIIIGGGIGGLSLALALHQAGITCRIFEAAPEIKPLGVGLNLLPHAVQELSALGLLPDLLKCGVETQEVGFYTRHGQLVYKESRGKLAGYPVPQISIHRADLHDSLLRAVVARLGEDVLALGHRCTGVLQGADSATAMLTTAVGNTSAVGDIVVGCDGIHSVVRKQLCGEAPGYRFHGTVQYRGVTRWKPFLTGRSMAYVGTATTGKLVVYPIRHNVNSDANPGMGTERRDLINWVVEIAREDCGVRDWNRRADYADFIDAMADWHFEWLDVPALIRAADSIYEYPVVDQDPLPEWTNGRITLLGDAAHPMLPRGSNGAAQAIIDANVLAGILAKSDDPGVALKEYEAQRLPATSKVVLMNRGRAPDAILNVVEERTGGEPFENLDEIMSHQEILDWQDAYKRAAGFQRDQVQNKDSL